MELTLEGPLKWAALVSMGILLVALALTLLRLSWGPSLPDRVVALDLIVSLTLGLITAYALLSAQAVLLDTIIVLAMVAFLTTVAFAYYLEKRV